MNHSTPADRSTASATARTASEPRSCTSCRKCQQENDRCGRAPAAVPELSIAQAIDFSLFQRELLNSAAVLLDRLALFPSGKAHEAAAVDEDFSALTVKLDEIARAQFQGGPVFSPAVTVVKLDDSGNKLVMPGVNLGARFLKRFTSSDSASPSGAPLAELKMAKAFLDLDHALVNECHARLTFLAKDLEAVKEGLSSVGS